MLRSDSRANQQPHGLKQQLKPWFTGKNNPMVGIQMQKIIVRTTLGTLIHALLWLPTVAEAAQLAVVKSLDNEGHWSGITARLRAAGVDYCVVDFAQVQRSADLGGAPVLLLPNIELLRPVQVAALQDWMGRGGRVIVTGPTGTLSQPEVRSRLRSLLGAYWGFALTNPSSLAPSQTATETWVQPSNVTGNIRGGVVIPSVTNSTPAAVWSQNGNPPGVVTTDKTTFLGWRWGVNTVASPELDSAWLRAALGRFGITPAVEVPASNTPPQPQPVATPTPAASPQAQSPETEASVDPPPSAPYCVPSQTPTFISTPSTPNRANPNEPDVGVAPGQTTPTPGERLSARQIAEMSQELENLIGRFESALLAANALNSSEVATEGTTNPLLVVNSKETPSLDIAPTASETQPPTVANSRPGTSSATQALTQARQELQNFRDAVAKQDYRQATQSWQQARRTLWDNYPIDRQLAQPEIRAIWLDRGTIVRATSEQDLAKIFDRLAAAGFNTVFFETVNASYPIYPSRIAPEQNPLTKGWDPLAAAVKLAHERGMELHAWVWIFAAANQRHNTVLNQPATYLGPILSAHPDWAMADKQGRLFDANTKKAFLDPANPEVRRYLLALLEEIVTRYQVDGVQLDYIRYPFQDPRVNQTYGYGKAARQQFRELTGVDPIRIYPSNREMWQRWTDFRIRQVDSFVATAAQRLRTLRPNLILSAAVFPLPRQERLQRLQQNWEEWAIRGDIDLMVPMTYAMDTTGLQTLAQPYLAETTLSSSLILPAIRLLNLPNIVAVDQIQWLRDMPVGGFALFAVENLDANLQSIFSRTQGRTSSGVEPIPYRQPFPAAAARYTALQQEWRFLLANNRILMLDPALSEWKRRADALEQALNTLATDPSRQNLASAKASVVSFRSQFPRWMQQQALKQPYQVQVWNNRLATIERLLRYGERTALNQNRLQSVQEE